MKSKLTNIGLNKSWNPKEGDYIRDKYEYDKSHEEILAKEKKMKKIAHAIFFVVALGVIIGILQILVSV